MTTEKAKHDTDGGQETEIVVERDGPVAVVWFNRPDRRNDEVKARMDEFLSRGKK